MKAKLIFISLLCSLLLGGVSASAQNAMSDEEIDRQLQESIDKTIETLTRQLKLEDWQVFYVDSILNHDYHQSNIELREMQKQHVSNMNLYYQVQDKWAEQVYEAFQKVFNEDQWKKYLKAGAARDKKARDKRAGKTAK